MSMSGNGRDRSRIARFAYMPQPDGPHARLGVIWFVVACAACALGTIAVAVLFAGLAAVAALQTVRAWAAAGHDGDRIVAGVGAAAIPLASLLGLTGLIGAGVVLVLVAILLSSRAAVRGGSALSLASVTLRSSLPVGLAAGSVVLIGHTDMGALVVLLLFVSVYEIGDYLVGSDAGSIFEGPLAGMAAVMVVTFAEAVFQIGPFETRASWIFGALVAVLAPLGAPLASALAPSARAAGPALRRIDAWLLVAPIWCWMLANYLGRIR
jgi:hypothetical protein